MVVVVVTTFLGGFGDLFTWFLKPTLISNIPSSQKTNDSCSNPAGNLTEEVGYK